MEPQYLPKNSPLPSHGSFIRLLDILPGHHWSTVECKLRLASLRSQLSYKALSYAWIEETAGLSTQNLQELIICDGECVSVSNNLCSALRTFRSESSTLTLWVDVLCINQQDTNERSKQVGMMRSIYSNSEEVMIWLGPNYVGDNLGCLGVADGGSIDDRRVVWHNDSRDDEMIRQYTEKFRNYEHGGQSDVSRVLWKKDIFGAFLLLHQLAQGTSLKELRFYKASVTSSRQIYWSSLVRDGIRRIEDSSWWQRTWVVQEAVLPRKATVHLGYVSAPWTMLADGAAAYARELTTSDLNESGSNEISRLTLASMKEEFSFNDQDSLSLLTKAILDLEFVRVARVDEIRLPLLTMLRCFRTKKSSDQRDKVFAILGLARDHVQASLKPDYNLSTDEVMLQTTIATICETSGLEALTGRVAGPQYTCSWTTNWHDLPVGDERERLQCLQLYDSSGGRRGMAHLHANAILELQGRFLGEVEWTDNEAPDDGFDRIRGCVNRWEQIWAHLQFSNHFLVEKSATEAFWRTITADTLYMRSAHHSSWLGEDAKYRRATSDGSVAFQAWKKDDSIQRRRKTSYAPGGLMRNYVQPEELSALKNIFHYAVKTACGARKFFATKNGFIGVGPAKLEKGDLVYVVLGSRVPLIMRPRPDPRECSQQPVRDLFGYPGRFGVQAAAAVCNRLHNDVYALVGDAYVHGVMDGEFVHGLERPRSLFVQ